VITVQLVSRRLRFVRPDFIAQIHQRKRRVRIPPIVRLDQRRNRFVLPDSFAPIRPSKLHALKEVTVQLERRSKRIVWLASFARSQTQPPSAPQMARIVQLVRLKN
jgi:hypothetical protein